MHLPKILQKLFTHKTEKAAEIPQGEIGAAFSRLYQAQGLCRYNPNELVNKRGFGVYDEMTRDDQVKAALMLKQHAIISRRWYFEFDHNDAEQQRRADILNIIIGRIEGAFSDKLLGILSALQYGFSVTEKVYMPLEIEGSTYWGLRDLKLRPASTFNNGIEADEHGNIKGFVQNVGGQSIRLEPERVIHFAHQAHKDPLYGESDLAAVWRSYWSKDVAIRFQNIHLERHAGGFVWASISKTTNLSESQRNQLDSFLDAITTKSSLSVPEGIDLHTVTPMSTDSYAKAIAQYDRAIARGILVPNLLGFSEEGQTGSYSQSQTQLQAFFWILDAIAAKLEEIINEQLIRALCLYNFGDENMPRFCFEPVSAEEKVAMLNMFNNLFQSQTLVKTAADEAVIRKLAGL